GLGGGLGLRRRRLADRPLLGELGLELGAAGVDDLVVGDVDVEELAAVQAAFDADGAIPYQRIAVLKGDDAAYARGLARDIKEMNKNEGLAKQMQYVEFMPWIKSFNVNYFLGADGMSIILIVLTNFLFLVCLGACWGMDREMDHGKLKYPGMKAFYFLYLLLQVGLVGVFAAQDLMLFYVFWEVVLLPMYFLIGIWGGPNRIYAAIKFFIYTLVGSVLMLIAFLYFYLNTGGNGVQGTFNVVTLMQLLPEHFAAYKTAGTLCFLGLFIGFAIKVPVVPFHTWLPDAHVQAPTPISMLLAGILLKMGGYGFFRFLYPFMPEQAFDFSTMMVILGSVSIVYGAYCAMGQTDFKKIVAYSSVSHMGYILLGLAAGTKLGMVGAAQQMIAHGISSAMMFGIVGVIYDRAHHRDVNRFGGIALQMPYYSGMAIIAFFASLGLPGLCGFIPEMVTFFGAFQSPIGMENGDWWMVFGSIRMWTVIASLGIVLTAVYLLWGFQRVYLGEIRNPSYKKFKDLLPREWATMIPLAGMAILLGVAPGVSMDYLDTTVDAVQQQMIKWDERYEEAIAGDDRVVASFEKSATQTSELIAATR
ncbi:MAG: NADH-quinone oxidoreductase subunit M, partial [Planctomycetes bacterium]|nr:NADH-quinone oxidoreductase subunit M [Planctomycetota bacterium]